MTAHFKPYPEMKDSGVEWLGEVPAHWKVLPICAVSNLKSVRNCPERKLLSVYLDKSVVRFSDVEEKRTNATSVDLINYQAVDPGDFVLNNQQAWRGSVGVSQYKGIVSPAYIVLSLNDCWNPVYANYLLRTTLMVSQYLIFSKGVGTIQRNLYYPELKRVSVILPSLPEQTAIVRYLDYVDRRVRRLTRVKRKLVTLLKEQKQAIIHRAVTRGLDPNAPMKDSGVEWLSEVPAHWEVRKLKTSISALINGVWGSEPNGVEDFPCVRVADFDRKRLRVHSPIPTIRAISPSERRGRILKPGDLLLEKSGGGDQQNVGVVILFDHDIEAVCSNFVARISVKSEFNSEYLVFLHAALYAIGLNQKSIKQTTGIQNLDSTAYLAELVAFPPLPEQTAIVEYLDRATADIDAAIDRANREVELLDEYRTRLIADVVTGKLDVREAATVLPEVDPLVPEDDAEDDQGSGTEANAEPGEAAEA